MFVNSSLSTSKLFGSKDSLSQPADDDIFAKKGPLGRLVYLAIGPVISQIVLSLNGFLDSYWVAKTIGQEGLAIFGAIFIVDFIAQAIGQYLITGLSARASYLLGQQEVGGCTQLFVDFIRIAFLASLLVPAIVLPIVRPLIEWFGGNKEFSWRCLQFMLPATCGSFMTFLYMLVCGQAQVEGYSIRYGLLQLCALLCDQVLFNPLFLYVLKTPIWGASLARICAEGIAAFIGIFLILIGKSRISPKCEMFFKKFCRDTWAGMKLGFASLIAVCSETIPMVIMQKFVNSASSSIGAYEPVLEVWGLLEKVYQFVSGISVAFSLGMLPSAAYSFGAGRHKDCMWTSLHMLWITTLCSGSLSVVLMIWPEKVASIWGTDAVF